MEKNTLVIEIKRPVATVFKFTLNPKNTPKWIPSIIKEKIFDRVAKVGTIYYQKVAGENNKSKPALVVTGLVKNKQLDFHAINKKYSCSYRYETIPSGTRVVYSEENGVGGKIESPMKMKNLQALKKLIEKQAKTVKNNA